ncbi:MAG TPA: hypothetical protein VNI58_04050 [Mariprofundaceae bacterium]|nr:hypothetical protein [Mariprofundaceae bacterium]
MLPTIFSAVSKVSDLFATGKETVKKVTGNDSVASTPEELQQEVQGLPPEQQAQWAQIMRQKVELYQAENQRLDIEIGKIDSNITGKLSEDAASKIAYMRMTTRPWTVKMMVYYILFPFALVSVDLIQELLKNWLFFWTDKLQPVKTFDYVFGSLNPAMFKGAEPGAFEKLVQAFAGSHAQMTLAGNLYVDSIPWVVGIIVSYMGLREIGKFSGKSSDYPETGGQAGAGQSTANVISSTLTAGADLISKVRGIFGK